jgi:hypothetical protein
MTTQEIAKRLYELCSAKLFAQAHIDLYSEDSVSIEPSIAHWDIITVKGKKAIMQKGKAFMTLVTEWNGTFTSQPIVYGSFIFMEMRMDLTLAELGNISLSEMGKFEVRDGKIISEEFYY